MQNQLANDIAKSTLPDYDVLEGNQLFLPLKFGYFLLLQEE